MAFKKKAMGSEEELASFTEQFNAKFKEIQGFSWEEPNGLGGKNYYPLIICNKKKIKKDVYGALTEVKSQNIEEKLRRDEYSNFYEFQNDINMMSQAYEV